MKHILALALLFSFLTAPALAQDDEIIVTASRMDVEPPGLFYVRKGDFLLLQVNIESDARDVVERLEELETTLAQFIEAAEDDPKIQLSFIDEGDFVRALSPSLYEDAIGNGRRPDTSVARIQVKTPIPDSVQDAFSLSTKLAKFTDQIEAKGRVTIYTTDEVTVSVVNPQQYRKDVVALVLKDIRTQTDILGPNYRVILNGMDRSMKSFRAGDLSLAFYLPYEYTIIPDTLHSYTIKVDEDY